jgi:hypothetical protein
LGKSFLTGWGCRLLRPEIGHCGRDAGNQSDHGYLLTIWLAKHMPKNKFPAKGEILSLCGQPPGAKGQIFPGLNWVFLANFSPLERVYARIVIIFLHTF